MAPPCKISSQKEWLADYMSKKVPSRAHVSLNIPPGNVAYGLGRDQGSWDLGTVRRRLHLCGYRKPLPLLGKAF